MSATGRWLDATLGQFIVWGTDVDGVEVQHRACGSAFPASVTGGWPSLPRLIEAATEHLEHCKTAANG